MSVYQIMYISSVSGAMSPSECANIADISAQRNRADDVTGLLLFNGKRFLQVLEGPKDAVDRVYARISQDSRHGAIVRLREGSVPTREFGNWGMTYDDIARPSETLKDKVAALLDRAGPSTRAHFLGSAELHRA